MDIRELRRENVRKLAEKLGGQVRLGERINRVSTQISQIIGKTPTRNIGYDLAREIEESLGLEKGSLDREDPGDSRLSEREPLYGKVPLISWVQAGDWCSISDYSGIAEDSFPSPAHCGPHTYALRVRGQSMEPRFHDGEIIFVDPDRTADHGSFVVVRLDDQSEATFKQLIIEPGGKKYLRPLNPDWPEKIIPINGNATICGRVIGKWEAF